MHPAIDIQDLSVTYAAGKNTVTALQNLTMTVPAGQVFGFLGPNGAGKTTAMHVLLGFIQATEGSASIFGTDVRQSIARQRIGYLAEHPNTYRFLTGRELLRAAGQLFRIPRKPLHERIEMLLDQLALTHAGDRRVGTYSYAVQMEKGRLLMHTGDHDLARQAFSAALAFWEATADTDAHDDLLDKAKALLYRALLREAKGQTREAAADLRDMLTIFPDRPAMRDRLAQLEAGQPTQPSVPELLAAMRRQYDGRRRTCEHETRAAGEHDEHESEM